jgi:O-succinylbenzoate synthase
MNDVNGGERKRLSVLAVIERKDKPTVWMKVGVAFPNRDGSVTLLLDAFPVGTNKLQVREEREWTPRASAANGNGFPAAANAFPPDDADAEARP